MYLEDEKQLCEDEDILIEILNEEALLSDSKERLLLVVATEITDICRVEETLHDKLFEYNVAKPIWENVVEHFDKEEKILSKNLVNFINANSELLSAQDESYKNIISSQYEVHNALEKQLIQCESLTSASYGLILKVLIFRWADIDLTGLSEDKVLLLISNNIFTLSKENFEYIKTISSTKIRTSFIRYHIISITDGELIEELDTVDYITIVYSTDLDKLKKQSFIEEHVGSINNILAFSAKKIIDIFDDKRLPDDLYENIKNTGNKDCIQYLFMNHNKFLKNDEILNLLTLMGSPFDDLNKDSKTKFDINEINRNLLDALYERKIIVLVKEINKIIGNSYYESRLRKDL